MVPSLNLQTAAALLLLLAVCVTATTAERDPSKPPPPHIVFVLVDDWGWANVGYHRSPPTKEVSTPHIDSLVRGGLELDQHYTHNQCSPSRSSLLTGRLPIHVNDQNSEPDNYNPRDPVSGFSGVPRNMTGLAEKLKGAGYATHMVGKWDAGMATPDHTPHGRGFDTSLGYFHHANDYYTEHENVCNDTAIVDLWDTESPASSLNGTGPDRYEEGLFKERLLNIVSHHDPATPLFLYYAPHIVHAPLQVPDEYANKFSFIDTHDRQYYHAMVSYLDDVIGSLTAALRGRGMWDNLLLVASSDNGGPVYPLGGGNNFPLKGGKISDWQGGVRVNAFVSGGYLPKKMVGKKTEGYIHLADWYGTFCSLVGVDPTDQRAAKANLPPVDSVDVWPLLSGETATSPRQDVPVSYTTLISGDYKILTGTLLQAGWTGPHYPNKTNPIGGIAAVEECGDGGCLYNIKEDPEEGTNLAASRPDILKDMQDRLRKYQATYFNPFRGGVWPGACEAALNKHGGFWGPFLP